MCLPLQLCFPAPVVYNWDFHQPESRQTSKHYFWGEIFPKAIVVVVPEHKCNCKIFSFSKFQANTIRMKLKTTYALSLKQMARREILFWIAASMSIFTNLRGRPRGFKIREVWLYQIGWIFAKIPNGLRPPPPHFRKIILQFFPKKPWSKICNIIFWNFGTFPIIHQIWYSHPSQSLNYLAHTGREHKGIKRRTYRLESSIRFFTWWGWWGVLRGDIGEGAFDGKFRANGSWLRLIEEKLPSLRNGGHHLSEKYNMKHSRHSFIL